MIVTRTPLRISLGGGGTDLPFYCSKHGASLITAAINKYIYITVNKRVEKTIKLNYSKTEIVDSVDEIKHPLIREALKLTGISKPLELHSVAELPSGTGLGSSQVFLVGLLNALYYYKGEIVSKYKLAEDASRITMDILKEPCGKQDQYAASFGNLNHLKINTSGKVTVSPVNISHEDLKKLENNLMMFYTGFQRSAIEILEDQKEKSEKPSEEAIFDYYHEIKKIGAESLKCLESGNLRKFGQWMNIHWDLKKGISTKMTNPKIDEWYNIALQNGALGGKIVGAGGGGFLMLYTETSHSDIQKALEKEGLVRTDFKFDFDGTRIVFNGMQF
ncbi:MAG: galactokinase [Nanoarchaeota archaeon]